MAQFDVCHVRGASGLFVVLQHDILDGMESIVVAPLQPVGALPNAATRLNPMLGVNGRTHVLVTQALAAVRAGAVEFQGENLQSERDRIIQALDFLFTGF